MTAQDRTVVTMAAAGADGDKAQRFRAAALPYLDDIYTLARYLLRDATDAEDAAQECYLRAFRHFETFRGGPIKPWLLAILRNVCRAEYARRGALAAMTAESLDAAAQCAEGLWSEGEASPEAAALERLDGETVQRLIAQLRDPGEWSCCPRERAGVGVLVQPETVSAHLRSLQAEHLTDVLSSNQHTVKPWFNGRIDLAPPVYDLTAQGFTLIGARLTIRRQAGGGDCLSPPRPRDQSVRDAGPGRGAAGGQARDRAGLQRAALARPQFQPAGGQRSQSGGA